MKRGKLGTLVDDLSGAVDKLPGRPVYPASRYTNRDAVNSAFGAFFFQFPSLLRYMRELQDLEKRDIVRCLRIIYQENFSPVTSEAPLAFAAERDKMTYA